MLPPSARFQPETINLVFDPGALYGDGRGSLQYISNEHLHLCNQRHHSVAIGESQGGADILPSVLFPVTPACLWSPPDYCLDYYLGVCCKKKKGEGVPLKKLRKNPCSSQRRELKNYFFVQKVAYSQL